VLDARGARRPLLATPLPGAPGLESRLAIERGVNTNGAWTPKKVAALALIMLPIIVLGGLTIPTLSFTPGVPRWVVVAVGIPVGALPAIAVVVVGRRLFAEHIAEACTAARICPSCGYDLKSAPVEADGCRICAECGGAWREKSAPPGEPKAEAPATRSADPPSDRAHPRRD
jgi:hypothetical protein